MPSKLVSRNIVTISGFWKTGSSSLIDALREIDGFNCFLPQFIPEFKIIRPPGIAALVQSIENDKDIAKSLERFSTMLRKLGQDHKFYHELRKKLKAIVPGTPMAQHSRCSLSRRSNGYYEDCTKAYLKRLDEIASSSDPKGIRIQQIRDATQYYFRCLASIVDKHSACDFVIFNQTIKPDPEIVNHIKMLETAKIIVVCRDPRDQFIELQNRRVLEYLFFNTWTGRLDRLRFGHQLVDRFTVYAGKKRREFYRNIGNLDRLMVVAFEDLVLRHEETMSSVLKFLEADRGRQRNWGRYFDLAAATKKVGMWRKHHDQDAMRKIAQALPEYCHSETIGYVQR